MHYWLHLLLNLKQLFLHFRHSDHYQGLCLGRESLGHILLDTADHEGAEDVMELGDHGFLGLLVVNIEVEPLVKLLGGGKDIRQEEVEKGPELVEVVL